jgi:tetratricopeptide (TPR) repeat protein
LSSAQTAEEIAALDREYSKLNRAGRFVDALPVYERYAEAVKAVHGQDSLQYAIAINNWAELLRINNRYPEALEMMRRVLRGLSQGAKHLQG